MPDLPKQASVIPAAMPADNDTIATLQDVNAKLWAGNIAALRAVPDMLATLIEDCRAGDFHQRHKARDQLFRYCKDVQELVRYHEERNQLAGLVNNLDPRVLELLRRAAAVVDVDAKTSQAG